jgi:hypothetical protein
LISSVWLELTWYVSSVPVRMNHRLFHLRERGTVVVPCITVSKIDKKSHQKKHTGLPYMYQLCTAGWDECTG